MSWYKNNVHHAMYPTRKEFAYATSDGLVFVRRFALSPEDLHLVRTLNGHCSEITQVRLTAIYYYSKWLSTSNQVLLMTRG